MIDNKKFEKIISVFNEQKEIINNKCKNFKNILKSGKSEDIFYEITYCILAAGTSAELALKTNENIIKEGFVLNANLSELVKELKKCYRFYNVRGEYIFNTREYLKLKYSFDIKKMLDSNNDPIALRNQIANDKNIRGLGMKAASHFLRNIGYDDLAILDIHVISLMKDLSLIPKNVKLTNKNYERIESILRKFSVHVKIELPKLDLVLWYMKTGKIIK